MPRTASSSPARRLLLPPLCAACWCGGPAAAADTSWTGGAGTPYWDDAANWSAGVPVEKQALLGAFDTTLRSGEFRTDAVQGSGTLTITGGTLGVRGLWTATVSALVLQGGRVDNWTMDAVGEVVTQDLAWSGGRVGFVNLRAVNAQLSGQMETDGSLRIEGASRWLDGASTLYMNGGTLRIAASGSLRDQALGASHSLFTNAIPATASFDNAGSYEKTGAGTTYLYVRDFTNSGSFTVLGGKVNVEPVVTGSQKLHSSTGLLKVEGGQFEMTTLERGRAVLGGSVQVAHGRVDITSQQIESDADWVIGEGGTVRLATVTGLYDPAPPVTHLEGGSVANDGVLQVVDGDFVLPQEVTGDGRVEVLGGGGLLVEGAQRIDGSLALSPDDFSAGASWLRFDLEDPAHHDSLHLGGELAIDYGFLQLSFADGLVPGVYRLITADGGLDAFGYVEAGLGFQEDWNHQVKGDWRLDLIYTATTLDVKVTLVPEPAAPAFMALGLLVLAAAARRRA